MGEINWIKITTDMFSHTKIKLIRKMPEGDAILNTWVQLICMAGDCNADGHVYVSEAIAFNEESLAVTLDRELPIVRLALKTLTQLNMIQWEPNRALYITNFEKYQNIEGMEHIRQLNAARNREYRKRLTSRSSSQLQLNAISTFDSSDVSVTSRDGVDKNKIRLEEDKNKNKNREELLLLSKNDEKYQNIFELYETNIEEAKNGLKELIISACEKYSPIWVIDAILTTRDKPDNKRNWEYITGILRNYETQGHKTHTAQTGGDADKFTKGKFGGLVIRTPEDIQRHHELKKELKNGEAINDNKS